TWSHIPGMRIRIVARMSEAISGTKTRMSLCSCGLQQSRCNDTEARSDPPRLGELDLDAELDLRQHGIEAGIAGGGLQIGGRIAQPRHRGGIELARQQAKLEIVEHVERALAAGDRATPALRRVLLDAL